MEAAGFGRQSGPHSALNSPTPFFRSIAPSPPNPSSSPLRSPRYRPVAQSPPSWSDGQRSFDYNGAQSQPRPRPVTSIVTSRSSESSASFRISRSQTGNSRSFNQSVPIRNNLAVEGFGTSPVGAVPIRQYIPPRTHSPELGYNNNHFVEGFRPSPPRAGPLRPYTSPRTYSPEMAPGSNRFVEAGLVSPVVPPRIRSPELGFKTNHSVAGFHPSAGASTVRPALFQPKSPSKYVNLQVTQDPPKVSSDGGSFNYQRSQFDGVQGIDQRRLAAPSPDKYSQFPQNNLKRPSFAHSSTSDTFSHVNFSTDDSQAPQMSLPRVSNTLPEAAAAIPTGFVAAKRSRSPPLLRNNQAAKGNSNDIQDDEREVVAKAKRLARFKVELGPKVQSSTEQLRATTNRHEALILDDRSKLFPEKSAELTEELSSEPLGSEPSSVIVGLCTDMCPESERAERERKGDLDRFERLDGDRNQTSKHLAVKKYNRTAEREAYLIRPMPVLQETIKYLLNLLEQPYDDRFLATYNFLWDRMRAIRMDLRMQHIFNQGAITMLEQMIRLHIIAMHELCEFSKGEGFSEGFDAHLNIEQMNKTSVELFQMYDDHRKKGIVVPTEKEFRGYYALLKLDKHPGYIVEPAELSLDLAKMTPEIRQTKEVLFARDVARACRTGNFIAFFRLARKASYLQACLMHAHFAKLRTQALASLHAGLQNNQGLPVVHVAEWLAMEEEDMDSLLEYHGFLVKFFDEPYMVKDGPFLNDDKDYETTRSVLVDTKKSGMIFEDVVPSIEVTSPAKVNQRNYTSLAKKSSTTKAHKDIQISKKNEDEQKVFPSVERKRPVHHIFSIGTSSPRHVVDETMDDFEAIPSPKELNIMQPITEVPRFGPQHEREHQLAGFNPFSPSLPSEVSNASKPSFDTSFSSSSQRIFSVMEERPLQVVPQTIEQDNCLDAQSNLVSDDPTPQDLVSELEEEEPMVFPEESEMDIVADNQDEEIAEAKLKLIIRLWKRHASRKRELRERRLVAAHAALDSLPLGLPVQLKRELPSTSGDFDIDHALRERYKKYVKSWSRLNVSEEIFGTLNKRNPDAKSFCWKMLVCSQASKPEDVEMGQRSQSADLAVKTWLSSKLMPTTDDNENDLIVSSPGLSIWKKWVSDKLCADPICCLSVVKDVSYDERTDAVSGANAVMFLVCDSIPWNLQKAQLQRLLLSIPSGSFLPLLILSGSHKDETLDHYSIISELGLAEIEKSRISSFQVISLLDSHQTDSSDGFFSDTRLREGLRWLASESPSQVVLHRIKTHDLVVSHLSTSLKVLGRRKDTEVNPNDCVWAFNEAIDRSLADIDAAAKENRNGWPCPEISLLEKTGAEHIFVEATMPESGWSSAEKIKSLLSALKDCKLPLFQDDLSHLLVSLSTNDQIETQIENQREEFGKSLIRYLIESCKLMRLSLAVKEARIMLQSSRIELSGSGIRIVPNWVMIFRRIFNWRLTSIASGPLSSAYILQHRDTTPAFDDLQESGLEDNTLASYHFNQPSLDEMIEVSCRSVTISNVPSLPEVNQVPRTVRNDEAQNNVGTSDLLKDNQGVDRDHNQLVPENGVMEVAAADKSNDEANRLSKLLEKCHILQNMIDEKLSVYF